MALHRDICKVGESPTQERRSLSPRMVESPENCPGNSLDTPSPTSSRSSTPEAGRSTPKGERRVSTRLLMQKGEGKGDASGKVSPQGTKSPKHTAWKTSKFFSRSMASGELMKGFKKLSTTSPSGSEDGGTEVKEPDTKSFKSRFSSLRRKSGSDSDTVPNVDSESLKLGSPEVRGIVCKKEDLMSLMSDVASKERRVSSPCELTVPLLPQAALPVSPVPVLKSPSLKVAPSSPFTRGSYRATRSASLDPTTIPNIERPIFHPQVKPTIRTVVYQPPNKRVTDDICIKKTGSFLEVVPEVKRRLSGPLIEMKEKIVEEENEDAEAEAKEPAVQWDDSNFVDPNLLGGAIEAFLKGMGSSPNPAPNNEKRVSFKKNLIK